ncbi:DUF421 domain-containing protein [Phytohalomonas tamaricis]|uniref:DUF421 domain-containing protein n=1 Tax=Phytohalomonas tamaricis TaxID=2081032 RepID=UPI000D0B1238|nr:YetF domain-containing protein [Phytohalomonas tamaricis]
MKPEDVYNLHRLLIGADIPWTFIPEVMLRIFVLYFLILVSMRLMGRRMASTMSRNEVAALVSLAAATGIGLQDPSKGLLPACVTASVVILVQRTVARATLKSKKFESITQGDFDTLVSDGCLDLKSMSRVGMSRERVFAQLRAEGIYNLGQVQRLYMESGGGFSVLNRPDPKPGLVIIPDWDQEFIEEKMQADETYVCGNCGALLNDNAKVKENCELCSHNKWRRAVI